MDWTDSWKFRKEMRLVDAAFLVCGLDPSAYPDEPDLSYRLPPAVVPILEELIAYVDQKDKRETVEIGGSLRNWQSPTPRTASSKETIKECLGSLGIKSEFFTGDGISALQSRAKTSPEYLDSMHDFYASKLAAAVEAWEAVTNDPKALQGKTPKQALEKWLRANAQKYYLLNKDSSINNAGIQQICKVANWQPEGGAAKTPSSKK